MVLGNTGGGDGQYSITSNDGSGSMLIKLPGGKWALLLVVGLIVWVMD
jgi:hypothetical protein